MAEIKLNKSEWKVQEALAKGEYREAERQMKKAKDFIRPVYRAIFEASIAFGTEDYQKAWESIAEGLRVDSRNYELYMMLGDYYVSRNLQQAYLCYENALFYCDDEEDARQIRMVMDRFWGEGAGVAKTAIVILSYNLLGMTRRCIESIRKTIPESAREIIVVDNASADGSVEWLKEQKDIKLLCNSENRGFPAGCNQGIELAEEDSDIFLLNNDTVMTDNALFWLRMGLYETEKVGSTGSVSNYVSNRQEVVENGKSEEFYLDFSKKNNVPLKRPYLAKVYLVGFALLIKRGVLRKTGLLDERFSPGNYEDNDICLRINLAGYSNVLCKNSFIIHWGSQSFGKKVQVHNELLQVNEQKFYEKWSAIGINFVKYMDLRADLVSICSKNCSIANADIMVAGTGCGALLSMLKETYPEAEVYGMEQNQFMAQIADKVADTVWTDFDEWKGDELEESFDIIFINDELEHTENPEKFLKELVKMLKKDGCLFISIINRNHYLRMLYPNEYGKLFDRRQVAGMLSDAKLSADIWVYTQTGNRIPDLDNRICELQKQHPGMDREEFLAYQWIAAAQKQRTDIQFGNRMVACIPTHEHSEVVEDVLFHCAELYKRFGLDVYYFDSSRDEETRRVIEFFQEKGYDNLNYIRIDPQMEPGDKFEYVLMLGGIQKEYEYMWYLRDRCWCEEKTLKLMYEAVAGKHDLIFMDVGNPNYPEELSLCNDANEFYHRCGDYATSMDTAIYNVNAILKKDFNMEEFRKKYDREYRASFLHFLIIFEQLAKKTRPDICLLAGKNVTIYHSPKGHSSWGDKRIDIWGKQWLGANKALPDCYTDKEEVIKRTASFPWILGDLNIFVDLHDRGILTPEYFEEIKGYWGEVSDISLDLLRKIACGIYAPPFDFMRLQDSAPDTLKLILQVYKGVQDGKMMPERVPMPEILRIMNEAGGNTLQNEMMREMAGQISKNIGRLMEEKPGDQERTLMLLQIVIGFMALAGIKLL